MESVTVVGRSPKVEVKAQLIIKDFLEEIVLSKPGQCRISDPFLVGEACMVIKVYPNGFKEKSKGNVSVILYNESDADVSLRYQVLTLAKSTELQNVVVPAKKGRGWDDLLTHAECQRLYKGKDFVVTLRVEIPGQEIKILGKKSSEEESRKPRCSKVWEKLFNKMQRSDFTLVFNGHPLECHKVVLSAASPVFEAMVENEHKEGIEGKANIAISEDLGRAFLRFIYTGELNENLLKEHAPALLELGEKYQMEELKGVAEKEMLEQLDKQNMVRFLSIGDLYNADDLREAALNLTRANMKWLRSQKNGMEEVKRLNKDVVLQLL